MTSFADKTFTPPELIRNFCVIAHIDHGKSTLADRMLQLTGVLDARNYRAQYLDRMDIERERGITIKAHNVRLHWQVNGVDHVLQLVFAFINARRNKLKLLIWETQRLEASLGNVYGPVIGNLDLPCNQFKKIRL